MNERELQALVGELYVLLDSDPLAAIARAREIGDVSHVHGLVPEVLVAGFFVDAGAATNDVVLVREALATLEMFGARFPERLEVRYNMANALSALAQLQPNQGSSWHLDTLEIRRRARLCYQEVILAADADTRACAHTNLGNELWRANRWVEAYDSFQEALLVDPSNAVARLGALKVLLRARDIGLGDPLIAEAIAARHLHEAESSRERLSELAGAAALRELDRFLALDIAPGALPDLASATPYERFVATHRLALALTIEGLKLDLKRWDSLQIGSVIDAAGSAAGVPPAFSVFNTAKAEYLAARWLCYQSIAGDIAETGSYGDSLDYAVYGMRPAFLILAQRASLDVLDKIAFLITEYLAVQENPRDIQFRTRWHKRGKKGKMVTGWHPALVSEIANNNRGLIALADVATDLGESGFLGRKKDLRDAGTHRVVVVHDPAMGACRESAYVTHVAENEFRREVIDTLRLARASLIYAVEAIAIREARESARYKFLVPLNVPPHDHIRGEDG